MTTDERLLELAAKCEQATAPDKHINLAIANAIYGDALAPHGTSHNYTGSIDAVMALVPEGLSWSVDSGGPTYPASAEIGKPAVGGELFNPDIAADGETPALALCAAALKARARTASSTREGL